jgi:hypothetical protein
MEIASKYNPAEVEDKWYKFGWTTGSSCRNQTTENLIQFLIPPPMDGVLHMGHMLNNTIQISWCAVPHVGKNAAGFRVPTMPLSHRSQSG